VAIRVIEQIGKVVLSGATSVKASLRDPGSLKEAFTDRCSVAISVVKATFATFNVAKVAFATPEVGVWASD